MKSLSIARRFALFLAAFVLVTFGTLAGFSYLLRTTSRSARDLASIAKRSSQAEFELLGAVVKLQSLTQQLLSSNDPDEMESLLGENKALVKQAEGKVQQLAGGNASVKEAFDALVKVNAKVHDLLLHARNIEARQFFIEKSNPAFQAVLGNIQKYQGQTERNLDEQAGLGAAQSSRIQETILILGGISVVAIVAFGVALGRSITNALRRVVAMVQDVAEGEGDLTKRLEAGSIGEIGQLTEWFNVFMEKLEDVISQVAVNTHRLATASEEISATATEQVRGAEFQKGETDRVAAAVQEMASTMQAVSEDSNKAAAEARRAAELAGRGDKIVKETLETMHAISTSVGETATRMKELEKSSDQIGRIIGVIDDVADQTNMLALNAAIEAARAGEQGRGFAVVAEEVRKLAERTGVATKEIAAMIHGIQEEMKAAVEAMQAGAGNVEKGVQSTSAAGKSLQEIRGVSQDVSEVIAQFDQAANQQSSAGAEISTRVAQIAEISRGAASGARESAKAVHELSQLAQDLQKLVDQFKIAGRNGHGRTGGRVARGARAATAAAASRRAETFAEEAEDVVRA